nr:MAG TPA: hypothetical protein [Caudoviricetes sp.]DAW11246.1 MAG TPA: hypothetical protein [Caudoviricetes sp.]
MTFLFVFICPFTLTALLLLNGSSRVSFCFILNLYYLRVIGF